MMVVTVTALARQIASSITTDIELPAGTAHRKIRIRHEKNLTILFAKHLAETLFGLTCVGTGLRNVGDF